MPWQSLTKSLLPIYKCRRCFTGLSITIQNVLMSCIADVVQSEVDADICLFHCTAGGWHWITAQGLQSHRDPTRLGQAWDCPVWLFTRISFDITFSVFNCYLSTDRTSLSSSPNEVTWFNGVRSSGWISERQAHKMSLWLGGLWTRVRPNRWWVEYAPVDSYCHLYFEILDSVLFRLTHRFAGMKSLSFSVSLTMGRSATLQNGKGFLTVSWVNCFRRIHSLISRGCKMNRRSFMIMPLSSSHQVTCSVL